MSKKGFVLHSVLVVVILIGIIAVGYFYFKRKAEDKTRIVNNALNGSPSSEEEDKWITYKNSRFGYEISYPVGWEVSPISYAGDLPGGKENPFDQDQTILIYSERVTRSVGITSQLPDNSVYLEVIAIPTEYKFQDWWNDHKETFEYTFEFLDTRIVVSGDQFPSDKIEFDEFNNQDELVGQSLFLWKENHLYIMYLKSSNGITNHKYLKQIADSLKLTPSKELLGWKTYRHSSGFSLELPNISPVIEGGVGAVVINSAMRGELTRCGCGLQLFVDILDNPKLLSIPDWWQEKYEQMDEHSQAHAGKILTPVNIGGYQAYKKIGFGGDSSTVTYFISSEDKIYTFSYSDYPLPNNPENTWQVETYEKIIQSFKIERNSSAN